VLGLESENQQSPAERIAESYAHRVDLAHQRGAEATAAIVRLEGVTRAAAAAEAALQAAIMEDFGAELVAYARGMAAPEFTMLVNDATQKRQAADAAERVSPLLRSHVASANAELLATSAALANPGRRVFA
jgi:hypothetical protein